MARNCENFVDIIVSNYDACDQSSFLLCVLYGRALRHQGHVAWELADE